VLLPSFNDVIEKKSRDFESPKSTIPSHWLLDGDYSK